MSQGYPRLINTLCDRALLTGGTKALRLITPNIIKECVAELSLPGENRKRKYQRPISSDKQTTNSKKGCLPYCSIGTIFPFGIPFNHDDNIISNESQTALDNLVELITQNPGLKIILRGYALGGAEYNEKLASFHRQMALFSASGGSICGISRAPYSSTVPRNPLISLILRKIAHL